MEKQRKSPEKIKKVIKKLVNEERLDANYKDHDKGEGMMELKGSKTEGNLRKAFSNELHAYAGYRYGASAAREAGYEQLADIFFQTALNEAEHAEHEFKLLGGIGDITQALKVSIDKEHEESTRLYPHAAQVAEEEGFAEIAAFFSRMGEVEKRHEKQFRELLDKQDKGEALEGRTVGHSAVDMAQVMLPDQANPSGYVHGGELMKLMDNAAGVAALRHCHCNVVTAMVNELHFLRPVRVGQLVLIHAKITFASHSSMEVRLEVEAEDLWTEKSVESLTAHFVMVALDKEGKPSGVPPLIICTEEEERLFNEGSRRYQARRTKPDS